MPKQEFEGVSFYRMSLAKEHKIDTNCLRFVFLRSPEFISEKRLSKIGANLCGLYLSGIKLRVIPPFLFNLLPNLKWLDVR